MSNIGTELLDMSGVKPKKGEDRADYLVRLVNKVQEIADEDEDKWDELSVETQNWANAATKAVKAEEPIVDFLDGEDDDEEPAKEDDTEEGDEEGGDEEGEDDNSEDDTEEEVVSTKTTKKKPEVKKTVAKKKAAPEKEAKKEPTKKKVEAKETDKKPAKKAAATEKTPRASSAPKETGVKVRIKKLLIKKPSMSVDDLMTKLGAGAGGAPSPLTVAGIRAEFRHSLHVLKGEGLLDIEI